MTARGSRETGVAYERGIRDDDGDGRAGKPRSGTPGRVSHPRQGGHRAASGARLDLYVRGRRDRLPGRASGAFRFTSSSRARSRSWTSRATSRGRSSSTGPREFTGDVSLLTDRPAVISAYARGETAGLSRQPGDLRRVIQEIPDLSDKLLEAFQTRRIMLERSGFVGVRVFGSLGDPDLTAIREFFDKNKVPHTWIDSDDAEAAGPRLKRWRSAATSCRSSSCNRGTRAARPTVTRLAECLGLKRPIRAEPFDLVIVGAGPAGLAAAVYGASEGLSTIVLDRFGPGGQAGNSSRIENYMGFPAGLSAGPTWPTGATSRP